jgi:acetyl esterase
MSTPRTPEGPAHLRAAGVRVTSVRYNGTIHEFVMLNARRDTHAAKAATARGGEFLRATRWDG